jgi:thiol-disulfide isomerase/thioredoxin/tetratricopeptide (TPR) repeat protein
MPELVRLVAFGFYLLEQGRHQEAAHIAADLLSNDERNAAAQRLYIASRLEEGVLPRSSTESRYRAWLAQSATDPFRRTILAFALGYGRGGPGDWCSEVERLVTPLPEDNELRYWAIRVKRDAHLDGCGGGDPDKDFKDLISLNLELAQPYIAVVRLASEPVEPELAAELKLAWERQPWRLESAARLWQEGVQGSALEQAKEDALQAAKIAKPYPESLWGALVVAQAAEESALAKNLEKQLRSLDAGFKGEVIVEVVEATQGIPSPSLALSWLWEEKSGLRGKEKARWWLEVSGRLLELGREQEAWEALKRVHRLDAELATMRWVEGAIQFKEHTNKALKIVEAWLNQPPEGAREPGAVGVWRDTELARRAMLYELASQLHRNAGDKEQAEDCLRFACLLEPDWKRQVSLGILLAESGQGEEALDALLAGLTMAPPEAQGDPQYLGARRVATSLWSHARWWDPEGMDGLIGALEPEPVRDAFIGKSFPDLMIRWNEQEQPLSAVPGPVVVDLWASWCGPCVQSLPHLSRLAEANPDIPFLAVSVDRRMEDATRFLSSLRSHAWIPGWVGPEAMSRIGIDAIPCTFILDAQHKIIARVSGWMPGDTRLEEAIKSLRATEAPVNP